MSPGVGRSACPRAPLRTHPVRVEGNVVSAGFLEEDEEDYA